MGLLKKGKKVEEEPVEQEVVSRPDAVEVVEAVVETVAEVESAEEEVAVVAEVVDTGVIVREVKRPDLADRQVAVVTTGTAVAAAASGGNAAAQLANDGFDGLDMGFGAFPMVALQNTGDFTSSGGWELGTEFDCVVMSSKNKYICKTKGTTEDDEDFFYSYDKVVTTTGEPFETKTEEWKEKGWGYEWKDYLEVSGQIHGGDHGGELILLSIPKTSIARFSGYLASIKLKHGCSPSEVITRIYRGDKVTKSKYPFFPWAFKVVGKVT